MATKSIKEIAQEIRSLTGMRASDAREYARYLVVYQAFTADAGEGWGHCVLSVDRAGAVNVFALTHTADSAVEYASQALTEGFQGTYVLRAAKEG